MSSVRDNARQAFGNEGLVAEAWSNRAGFLYRWHVHPYDKAPICVEGSITFHIRSGDIVLTPGDRLYFPAGTEHAATVGRSGVACLEGAR